MYNLLLYTQTDTNTLVPVLWIGGALLFLWLFFMIFVQRRTGRKLQRELVELERARRNNVESEFVLKAMKLSTWHIDVPTMKLYVDADYREKKGGLLSPHESLIEDLIQVLDKADGQRVRMSLDKVCLGQTPAYHEVYRVKLGKGAMTYWEESFGTIAARDMEGKPSRIVGTSMRIDNQKQMEADLIAARNKAEESDRLKTAFLANMGHEIRTPLNAIVGFADLLPVVQSEEDRNQLISEIQANNRKLLRIIDGLVSMSKIEAGAKSLLMAKVDLNQLIQQMVDTYQPTTNVQMTCYCPLAKLEINSDREKLLEILDNLVQNAVKFTAEGSIALTYEVEGNQVRVSVSDTGKGISEADQKRIFERFVKVDEFIPGTGLGLSVAKSHVENLGGQIGVISALGTGTTFWFTLPLEA